MLFTLCPKEQAMMLQLGVSDDYGLEAVILISMATHLLSLVAWIVALSLSPYDKYSILA
jgi:hypothetical protein